MDNRIPTYRHLVTFLVASGVCLLTSCAKLQDFLINDKLEVKNGVDRMKVGISNDDWNKVFKELTPTFEWTSLAGHHFKPHRRDKFQGRNAWKASIDALPKDRIAFFTKVEDVTKINDTRILAKVTMRLRIRKHAADVDNIAWKTNQIWVKEGKDWKLASIKDTSEKRGHRMTYGDDPTKPVSAAATTNTSRKPARKKTDRAKHKTSARTSGTGGLIDYGTGATSLKAKKKSRNRLQDAAAKRQSSIEAAQGD